MRQRGGRANPPVRKPGPNSYRNARYRDEITVNSIPYWDLVLGDQRHWPDEFDEARERAWREWAPRIYERFPKRYGQRPAAFFSFEATYWLARERDADRLTDAEVTHLLHHPVEWVYRSGDADEREMCQIEESWRRLVELFGSQSVVVSEEVPVWFIRRERLGSVPPHRLLAAFEGGDRKGRARLKVLP